MLKSRRLFVKLTRAAILVNRSQVRRKTQCMDGSIIPAPFGLQASIIVKCPYSVKIEPLDPVEYGNIQAVVGFLYLRTDSEEDLADKVKTRFQKDIQYNVQAVMSPTRDYFEVTCSEQQKFKYPSKDIYLHFYVPVDYGVEIQVTGKASVDVSNLEGHMYEIITQQGACRLTNLRGSRLSVETSGGDIVCDSQLLSEFGILDTKGKGKISVKKLQGGKFCVDTEDGDIDVGASYLLRAELTSKCGRVNLGDIHGLTEVAVEKGDISIGSVSGKLKAVSRSGNIDANLSLHDDVLLKSEQGNIDIKTLEDTVSSEVKIKSKSVSVNSNVNFVIDGEDKGDNFTVMTGTMNPKDNGEEEKKTIKIEAKLGSVKLEKKDWFSTLKLK